MQLRKKYDDRRNKSKLLYNVIIKYVVTGEDSIGQYVWVGKKTSLFTVYAYNKDEAIRHAKRYLENYKYPHQLKYTIEYSSVTASIYDTLEVYTIEDY